MPHQRKILKIKRKFSHMRQHHILTAYENSQKPHAHATRHDTK